MNYTIAWFKDDMVEIYEKLTRADTIVIATLIYFYGMTSQLKVIIDQLHNPIRNTFKVKRLALFIRLRGRHAQSV